MGSPSVGGPRELSEAIKRRHDTVNRYLRVFFTAGLTITSRCAVRNEKSFGSETGRAYNQKY
jgi:hypothetical protein